MGRAWRAAGVGIGAEFFPAIALPVVADDEIAGDEINLFPVVVHERFRRVDAGREAQVARAVAALPLLVEGAGEYLLLDSGGIAGRRLPARARVRSVEFLMFLVDSHVSAPVRPAPKPWRKHRITP